MPKMRIYGVSHGNGNDGVSHMFPEYYVRTTDPWYLARLALVGYFKPKWRSAALIHMDVQGDDEYGYTACLYEPLDVKEGDEGYGEWCEHNGAWHITEIFPVADDETRAGLPIYEGLDEAYTEELLAKVPD
jgi:hypothetical protein